MVRYPGNILDAPVLRICPTIESIGKIDLKLQSSDNSLPLERFDALLEDIKLKTETGKMNVVHSIQDATGMDEKYFSDIFCRQNHPVLIHQMIFGNEMIFPIPTSVTSPIGIFDSHVGGLSVLRAIRADAERIDYRPKRNRICARNRW